MFSDTQVYAFSNVHMKIRDLKTHRVIREIHKKNTITKYALNGIASMIKGEFDDTNYNRINMYVPKYLALGTNMPSQRQEDITVGTSITVFDNSLLSEIVKNDRLVRVKLEEARRIDNLSTNEYVKVRFKAMVMSGVVGYSTAIQELGLFVDNTELIGGLWARISTDPIAIPENSVLDVIWDVVLASSVGVYPSKIQIFDANGRDVSGETLTIAYNEVCPISVNLESSIIDGVTSVLSKFYVDDLGQQTIDGHDGYRYISTNNFSLDVKTVEIYYDTDIYKIRYKYNNDAWESFGDEYSTIEAAQVDANNSDEACTKQGYDIQGNLIIGNNVSTNTYIYKEVTYKNCEWKLEHIGESETLTLVDDYKETIEYAVGDFAIYEDIVYRCISATSGIFDISKWFAVMTWYRYMYNCVIIDTNYDADTSSSIPDEPFKLTAIAASDISASVNITVNRNT